MGWRAIRDASDNAASVRLDAPPRPPAGLPASVLAGPIGTRLTILLLGAVVVMMVGTVPAPTAEALWRVSSNELANLQARWDTDFYNQIATRGYRWDPSAFLHQNVVFFPLYPLLMRWGGALLGGHPLLAGTIASFAAFAGAIALLYRLAVLELGEEKARSVLLLLSTYPFALFYSAVYTESVFLLLTVGAFYAMRRRYLVLAALSGLAAGLTRPNGFWLALPLLWIAASAPPWTPQSTTPARASGGGREGVSQPSSLHWHHLLARRSSRLTSTCDSATPWHGCTVKLRGECRCWAALLRRIPFERRRIFG